jgi:hypothetical protein
VRMRARSSGGMEMMERMGVGSFTEYGLLSQSSIGCSDVRTRLWGRFAWSEIRAADEKSHVLEAGRELRTCSWRGLGY